MKLLQIKDLENLISHQNQICISIYMPAHPLEQNPSDDRIALKNLLRKCELELHKHGFAGEKAAKFLEPASALLLESPFWSHQSTGLALFISQNLFNYYRLPLIFKENLVISDRFHVKPLLPLFTGDGRFYLLTLSQKQIRFFEGTRYSMREVQVPGMPKDISEIKKYIVAEKSFQMHPGARNGAEQTLIQHGIGSVPDDLARKKDLVQFAQAINNALLKLIAGEKTPLITAGVDYVRAIYKEVNGYSNLIENGIAGNTALSNLGQLHKEAWSIIEPYFAGKTRDVLANYKGFAGTGHVSSTIEEIAGAAYIGRVQTLLIDTSEYKWGKYYPETGQVEVHETFKPGDGDLMDFAVFWTLMNSGVIYSISKDKIPDKASAAAIFRYMLIEENILSKATQS